MLYTNDIKSEYLNRLTQQAKKIQEISKVLDYKNNRENLTDSQVDLISNYVDILETIKNELLKLY